MAQAGADLQDFSAEETGALMDSLKSISIKSSQTHQDSYSKRTPIAAGNAPTRLSEASVALTGNDLELHNMLQTATGGASSKPSGPLSDDGGSSLKSLEYSQASPNADPKTKPKY